MAKRKGGMLGSFFKDLFGGHTTHYVGSQPQAGQFYPGQKAQDVYVARQNNMPLSDPTDPPSAAEYARGQLKGSMPVARKPDPLTNQQIADMQAASGQGSHAVIMAHPTGSGMMKSDRNVGKRVPIWSE